MENRELMWLELMKFYGLKEIPGAQHNPIILEWWKYMGYDEIKDDETNWCSLVINVMAKKLSLHYSGKLDARSWLKIGRVVTEPKIGHVVVFYRNGKEGWEGHVALFAGWSELKDKIFVLGGNQSNSVSVSAYPVDSVNVGLLGFREL